MEESNRELEREKILDDPRDRDDGGVNDASVACKR